MLSLFCFLSSFVMVKALMWRIKPGSSKVPAILPSTSGAPTYHMYYCMVTEIYAYYCGYSPGKFENPAESSDKALSVNPASSIQCETHPSNRMEDKLEQSHPNTTQKLQTGLWGFYQNSFSCRVVLECPRQSLVQLAEVLLRYSFGYHLTNKHQPDDHSKKSPTGPMERTLKPGYLIARSQLT